MTDQLEHSPVAKSHRWFIVARWYCSIMLPGWWIAGAWDWTHGGKPYWMVRLALPMLPAMFMIFNWMAFRFDFSVFGRYERTRAPAGESLREDSVSGGQIGLFMGSWPLLVWRTYPGGIGFSILGVGEGYVPFECVTEVRESFFYGVVVTHKSEEIRSPLRVPALGGAHRISEAFRSWRGTADKPGAGVASGELRLDGRRTNGTQVSKRLP